MILRAGPYLISPSKITARNGLSMEVYDKNGLLIVAADDDSIPMEDMLSVDLQGGVSGIAEGSIGRLLASDATLLSVGSTLGFDVPVGSLCSNLVFEKAIPQQ